MNQELKEEIQKVLSGVQDPELRQSLTELNMVRDIRLNDKGEVEIVIALTVPNCPLKNQIENDVRTAVSGIRGVEGVSVKMTSMTADERQRLFGEPKEGAAMRYNRIKRVITVMSGKGGVGKSLVTGLLAAGLAKAGYKTGILDADITGPSIPKLFGLRGPLEMGPVGLRPAESPLGVRVMSMNLIMEEEDKPVIWRGPLIGKTITQLFGDVMWGDLDYLLVDLPPGTSDASLTTLQSLPVDGVIMVTTPQSLASLIVRKAVHMTELVGAPILGVVENMAYFACPDTGKLHYIFGPSHTDEITSAAQAPLLAQIPIAPQYTALCDAGRIETLQMAEAQQLVSAFIDAAPR